MGRRKLTAEEKRREVIRIRRWRKLNPLKGILTNTKHRTKKLGLEFDIDKEFIEGLLIKQNNRCAYSGIEFSKTDGFTQMSIDRINSKKGYTKDNVQLVILAINYMKQDYPEDVFIELCKKVAENRK